MLGSGDSFLLIFLVSLALAVVESDILYDVLNRDDPCEDSCDKTYPTTLGHSMTKYSTCCRRGCRFFSLVYLVEGRSELNATREQCEASCMEAYTHTKERYACNIGCSAMAKQRENDVVVAQFSLDVYVEDANSMLVVQQPGEFDDVLTDPGLLRQLERAVVLGDDDNRLPETHIRSLPADQDPLLSGSNSSWLDCLSRRSGLPRYSLGGIVLMVLALLVFMCVAPGPLQKTPPRGCDDDLGDDLPPKYEQLYENV